MNSLPFGHGRRRLRKCHNAPEMVEGSVLNLSSMQVGGQGTIISLLGRRCLRRRLMEMGLIEGSKLRVVKFAPTGDPIEIQVNDYFLSLRREDADRIIVDPQKSSNTEQE